MRLEDGSGAWHMMGCVYKPIYVNLFREQAFEAFVLPGMCENNLVHQACAEAFVLFVSSLEAERESLKFLCEN